MCFDLGTITLRYHMRDSEWPLMKYSIVGNILEKYISDVLYVSEIKVNLFSACLVNGMKIILDNKTCKFIWKI